ncbi:hypothetical protein SUGI_0189130 [Cryptomeria japonica]|nr:hypothetical protein SUGI_0189130 [Cryptomeria japonica]
MDKHKIQVNNQQTPARSRKRVRLTDVQIQEMEDVVLPLNIQLVQGVPAPKNEAEAGPHVILGLAPHRVQYWFQNRLAQMKAAQMTNLHAENEILRSENRTSYFGEFQVGGGGKIISHSIRIRCDLVKAAMNVAKEVIQMALVGSSGSSTTPTKDLSSFHGYHRSSL